METWKVMNFSIVLHVSRAYGILNSACLQRYFEIMSLYADIVLYYACKILLGETI